MNADKYQGKNNISIKSPCAKKMQNYLCILGQIYWLWTCSINTFLMDKKNCLLQFSVKIGIIPSALLLICSAA